MTGPQSVPSDVAEQPPPDGAPVAGTGQGTGGDFGDARVEAAVARLDAVAGLPGSEQVAEYEAVHRALQDTLATVDEA